MNSNNSTVMQTPSESTDESNSTTTFILDTCDALARYTYRKTRDKIFFGILISIGRRIQSLVLDISFLSDIEQWFMKICLGDFYTWVSVHLPIALHALECVSSFLLALAVLGVWSLLQSNKRIASIQQEIDLLERARIK